MERRVLRELDTASFMKQQILVRALIKNSMDVKMKSKLELGYISTEEDRQKKAGKKASESETDKFDSSAGNQQAWVAEFNKSVGSNKNHFDV